MSSFAFFQESVETLSSGQFVFVFAGVSSVHGLHDFSVFPDGLLAAYHHLQQCSDFIAGNGSISILQSHYDVLASLHCNVLIKYDLSNCLMVILQGTVY